jgi:hypothetical protein
MLKIGLSIGFVVCAFALRDFIQMLPSHRSCSLTTHLSFVPHRTQHTSGCVHFMSI